MTDLTRRQFLYRVPLVVAGTVAAADAARSDVLRTWVRRFWPGFGAGTLRPAPPVWPPVGELPPDAFYAEWPVMHYGPPMTNLLDRPEFRAAIADALEAQALADSELIKAFASPGHYDAPRLSGQWIDVARR